MVQVQSAKLLHLKANKMISKASLYYIVRVNDLYEKVPSIDSVSIVNDFPDVFPKYLQESLLNVRLIFVLI